MVICKIIIQSLLLALLHVAVSAPQLLLGMPKHQGMPVEPVAPVSAGAGRSCCGTETALMEMLLAESSASSAWAVPTQSPCVTQSSCHASAQEMLLLRSAALEPRREEGIIWRPPHHQQTPIFVLSQPRPGQCGRAGAGRGGISGGSFAAPFLLKQHHAPDCVCTNHQTLTGAACSHRNTGTERAN